MGLGQKMLLASADCDEIKSDRFSEPRKVKERLRLVTRDHTSMKSPERPEEAIGV
jgi:hypothetical protein